MPAALTIDIQFDLASDFEAAMASLREEVDAIGLEMRDKVVELLKARGKKATGDLIDSVDREVETTLQGITLSVGPRVTYADAVEEGLKPGKWRPIDPLKRWARAKFGATGKEKNAIAYAVRRKIYDRGTEGAFALRDTMAVFMPTIAARIVDAVMKGLE